LWGIEQFEGEIENFILNTFINCKPLKRLENRSGVSEFRSFNNGTSKRVLDLLETMYWRLRKIVVQRVRAFLKEILELHKRGVPSPSGVQGRSLGRGVWAVAYAGFEVRGA